MFVLAVVGVAVGVLPAPTTAAAAAHPTSMATGSPPTGHDKDFSFRYGDRFGPIPLARGWWAATCQPDEHFVCLADPRRSGYAEWRTFPLDPLPPDPGAAQRDLRERARQFLTDLAKDREIGCPGYGFRAEPLVSAPVIGLHGIRLDFRLTAPSGGTVERTVAYWARQDTRMFILAAEALDPGSCLDRIGDQFTVAGLRNAEPALRQLARRGAPPPADPPPTRQ